MMKPNQETPGGGKPLDILSGGENQGTGDQSLENNNEGGKPIEKQKKAGATLMQKVGVSALFFLIGMLVVALALYLPAASQLREAQAEVERLSGIEAQHEALQDNYARARREASIYKAISSVGLLEAALIDEDGTRVSQQLRYVEDDLSRLEAEGFPEVKERLMSQFRKVRSAATGDAAVALNELRALLNDLLLFADYLP